jgi:MFS transporter, DHA1 family, inner membrane transport protein
MNVPSNIDTRVAGGVRGDRGSWALVRWLFSYGTFSVPQAAGPIAFTLLVMPLTSDPSSGAAIVLVMTIGQVVGAVPVARFGQNSNAVSFLKALVAIRTLALAAIAMLAAIGAPFNFLLVAAALAGLVSGAAFGYLRSVLNYLVEAPRMPRALGLAATLNELIFVSGPVLASVLGTLNPVLALLVLTALGATTMILMPSIPHAKAAVPVDGSGGLLTPAILLWLGCTIANSAVVSSIEIGAVLLAIKYGFEPAQGVIFTVALCMASVAGGVWVSARNRIPCRSTIFAYLVVMSAAAILIASDLSLVATLAGAIVVGCIVAPLVTSCSLQLDALLPAHRRAEVFAMSRIATSIGIILTSTNLTLTSLAATQVMAAAVVCAATVAVGIALVIGRAFRP